MYDYLLLLALIMISTKICGLLTEKVSLPQVLGSLLAGIILGPSFLGILYETDFLIKTSEIGVILLMFIAGLDTDMDLRNFLICPNGMGFEVQVDKEKWFDKQRLQFVRLLPEGAPRTKPEDTPFFQ